MQRRSFNWVVALVAVGLAGVVVATVLAAPAPAAATPFELTVEAKLLPPDFMASDRGTFRSQARFCARGSFVEDIVDDYVRWQFTCDDGSGSLTLALPQDPTWRIIDGSGSYAGLRGSGSLRFEQLCKPWLGESCDFGRPIPWRGTLVGLVDWGAEPDQPEDGDTVPTTDTVVTKANAVAPAIAIDSARAVKLHRPSGFYSIRVAVSLRDDVEGNTVAYNLRVMEGGRMLAITTGTTASGSVSTTLRVVPGKRVRSVQLLLTASDPVGNGVSITRSLKLPR
jgi:hypothetical protein